MHRDTDAIRTQAERSPHKEHSVPVFLTSSFVFDDAEEMRAAFADEIERNIYSRFTNPNVTEFVDKMCDLEGAEAGYATATGMAAVFATFAGLLGVGDHIVSGRAIFGSTHTILTKIVPRFGITHSYVDVADGIDAWAAAITPATRMIYVETPTNPGLEIADLDALGALAAARGVLLVVDNCMSTPVLQQPLRHGAHLSVHSATKFIDGQGRVMGGVVVGRQDLIDADLHLLPEHRPGALAVQRLGAVQEPGDALAPHGAPCVERARPGGAPGEEPRSGAGPLSLPAVPPRSTTSRAGRCRRGAGSSPSR